MQECSTVAQVVALFDRYDFPALATPTAFQISADSVVGITDAGRELRVTPVDGSSPPVVLADPEDVFRNYFRLTLDGRLVFEASPLGVFSLRKRGIFTVPMDGSAKGTRILGFRGDPLPSKHEVSLQGDVVFVGYSRGWQLFSVPIDGGPAVQLNPPMVAGGDIVDGGSALLRSFRFSPDGSWVLYAADQEHDRVQEIFAVAPDGSRPARKVNGPLPPGGDVLSYVFAPDSRRVLYSVWASNTREVFTSVIADGETLAIERPIGNTPTQPFLHGGLVEDPRRMGRGMGAMDATRAKPERAPRFNQVEAGGAASTASERP